MIEAGDFTPGFFFWIWKLFFFLIFENKSYELNIKNHDFWCHMNADYLQEIYFVIGYILLKYEK